MSKDAAQFVFMTCRPGAEGAVKEEVARVEPAWRFAFSRPGFLTFKVPNAAVDDRRLSERHWTFAYTHGVSLGHITGSELQDLAAQVWTHGGVVDHEFAALHVWQPQRTLGDESDHEGQVTPCCEEIDAALRAAAPERQPKLRSASNQRRRAVPRGGLILDVMVLQPGDWWLGYHRAVRRYQCWPGGAIPVRLPAHAVSRAYAKMEEALLWSDLPVAASDECVEIGCAPGGASQALLDRGLFVTGIDPADVDPAVLEHPRFRHLKKRGREVRHQEFEGVRWLAADMNIAPERALDEVEIIVTHPEVAIRGIVLTLKLADWSTAGRLPQMIERVRGWGYRDVRARQLVTGGQEVCLVALRRKELRRLGRRTRTRRRRTTRGDDAHKTFPGPHF